MASVPRWLLKTEPSSYSLADLERDRKTVWDGVRNVLALSYLRRIRKGDLVLVYHTGEEKAVVGVARAESDPYPDPEGEDEKLLVVDVGFVRRLARPVPLAALRKEPALRDWALLRLPRLSVLPVGPDEWRVVERLAGERTKKA